MKSRIRRQRKYVVQVMRVIQAEQDYRLIFTFQGIEANGNSIFPRLPGLQNGDECMYTFKCIISTMKAGYTVSYWLLMRS
ncbi:hypothetical protein DXN04_29340 [Chitinophaga silvisoli]|uniref:Uncharacterized protein n=1 Tax=Chitinophaga silvisoli TaxID=2291814 RepID=A0A3E1NTJ5_9BACT|nr:hypothetical protein DXN04_29340 [Chitinophaga silvisoli]